MREILFRGKLSHSKVWVEGNIVFSQYGNPYILPSNIIEQDGHHLQIIDDNAYWVDIDTIGQYTGLNDKNGTKIFEGDVCHYIFSEHRNHLCVKWISDYACFAFVDKQDFDAPYYLQRIDERKITVVGNIHDNPNLIK